MLTDILRRSPESCILPVAFAIALVAVQACSSSTPPPPPYQTFDTPEQAVDALVAAAKAGKVEEMIAIFGPDGRDIAASSDPTTARMNRQVFNAAVRERKTLVEDGPTKRTLVIGKEDCHREAYRAQRTGGDCNQPRVRHGAAAIRGAGSRWQACRAVRDGVQERSGEAERPVLADEAW
jgi:hypothetical protein